MCCPCDVMTQSPFVMKENSEWEKAGLNSLMKSPFVIKENSEWEEVGLNSLMKQKQERVKVMQEKGVCQNLEIVKQKVSRNIGKYTENTKNVDIFDKPLWIEYCLERTKTSLFRYQKDQLGYGEF